MKRKQGKDPHFVEHHDGDARIRPDSSGMVRCFLDPCFVDEPIKHHDWPGPNQPRTFTVQEKGRPKVHFHSLCAHGLHPVEMHMQYVAAVANSWKEPV